jgi:hypothetical protein
MAQLLRAPVENGDLYVVQPGQAPLAADVEAADRFNPVAEQFDPHRVEPVRSEHVQQSAPQRDLSRQLDRRGVVEAVLDQPRREVGETHFVADAEGAGLCGQPLPLRHRLQEAVNARNEEKGARDWGLGIRVWGLGTRG